MQSQVYENEFIAFSCYRLASCYCKGKNITTTHLLSFICVGAVPNEWNNHTIIHIYLFIYYCYSYLHILFYLQMLLRVLCFQLSICHPKNVKLWKKIKIAAHCRYWRILIEMLAQSKRHTSCKYIHCIIQISVQESILHMHREVEYTFASNGMCMYILNKALIGFPLYYIIVYIHTYICIALLSIL